MELYYILYQGKVNKYLLILPLGNRKGKLCAIDTAKCYKNEISIIRSRMDELSALSLEDRIDWIRRFAPSGYKEGYREISDSNFIVVSKHGIHG